MATELHNVSANDARYCKRNRLLKNHSKANHRAPAYSRALVPQAIRFVQSISFLKDILAR